jgi:aldehyde dehydrogenase (NAD+)
MNTVDRIYISGRFVTPPGTQTLQLVDPVTDTDHDRRARRRRGRARRDRGGGDTRARHLDRLRDAVLAREADLVDAMVEEYGGPRAARPPPTSRR